MRGAPTRLAQRAFSRTLGRVGRDRRAEELARARGGRRCAGESRGRAGAARCGACARHPVARRRARRSCRRPRSSLAYRNLKRTTIVAPVDGTIGQRSVQVGQQVARRAADVDRAAQPAVDRGEFQEGQIRHMRIGQPVEVVSDLYGSRVTYRGRVQGFSAGTGSAFDAAVAECGRQLDQGRAARAGRDRARCARSRRASAARRVVDARDGRHARSQRPRARQRAADAGRQHARARRRRERRGSAAAAIIRDNQGG